MKLLWSEDAWEDYLYWQKNDREILGRLNILLGAIYDEAHLQGSVNPGRHRLHAAGFPLAVGCSGAVASGKVDRGRRRVAVAAGINGVEGRAVTAGEQHRAAQHRQPNRMPKDFIVVPGWPFRAGPGTYEHWPSPRVPWSVLMDSGLAGNTRAPE